MFPALLALAVAFPWGPLGAQEPAPEDRPEAEPRQEVDVRHPLAVDGRLEVEVANHALRIEVWDQEEVHILGSLDPALQRFDLAGDARDLTARVVHLDPRHPPAPGLLDVRVPAGADLSVRTTSGAVRMEGVAGPVRVRSSTGAVRVRGTPPRVEATSVTGSIELSGSLPRVWVRSGSGRVEVRGAHGRIDATTESGPIHLRAEGPVEHLRARSTGGSVAFTGELAPEARVGVESHVGPVTLRIPPATPGTYRIRSFGGTIRNELTDHEPHSPRWDLSTVLGFAVAAGTARIHAASFGGTVTLASLP